MIRFNTPRLWVIGMSLSSLIFINGGVETHKNQELSEPGNVGKKVDSNPLLPRPSVSDLSLTDRITPPPGQSWDETDEGWTWVSYPQGRGRGRGAGRGAGRGNGGGRGVQRDAEAQRNELGRGRGADAQFAADRAVFQRLLMQHDKIRRDIQNLDRGVETLTESEDPEIAKLIQKHVRQMYARVEKEQPIHQRDPLFRELFRHADAIEMAWEDTEKGIRVREVSNDPYVVKLIQAHAQVVSQFVANGPKEAQRNHQVPAK